MPLSAESAISTYCASNGEGTAEASPAIILSLAPRNAEQLLVSRGPRLPVYSVAPTVHPRQVPLTTRIPIGIPNGDRLTGHLSAGAMSHVSPCENIATGPAPAPRPHAIPQQPRPKVAARLRFALPIRPTRDDNQSKALQSRVSVAPYDPTSDTAAESRSGCTLSSPNGALNVNRLVGNTGSVQGDASIAGPSIIPTDHELDHDRNIDEEIERLVPLRSKSLARNDRRRRRKKLTKLKENLDETLGPSAPSPIT